MTNNLRDGFGSDHQRQWVLGTTVDCDVRLLGSQVSGRVARLCKDRGSWTIAPLEGAVSVRGERALRVTPIDPRDDVRIAGVALPWPSTSGARNYYTVGRSRNCDIRIGLPGVSGQHARLIVGHHGTYVLEDLRSTNGIFADAERRHPVRFIQLNRDITVYFGSTPIAARDLIDAVPVMTVVSPKAANQMFVDPPAKTPTEQAEQDQPGVPKSLDAKKLSAYASRINSSDSKKVRQSKKWLRASTTKNFVLSRFSYLASALVTLPLMVALVLWGKGYWLGSAEDLVDTPLKEAVSTALPNLRAILDVPDPLTESIPQVSTEAHDATESLFWVVVEVRQDNTTYRLGTAVAVAPDRLLTTGSIVIAGEKLCEQLGGKLRVQHIKSAERSDIYRVGVHPALAERLRLASVAKKQFEDVGQGAEPLTDEQRQEADRKFELVNLSFSAVSSADVGWLAVRGDFREIPIDSETRLRPRQAVEIYHSGFDSEDPFVDASASTTTAMMESRIVELAPTLQAIHGHAKVALGTEVRGLNLFGAPVLAKGQLLGIISYTDSPGEGIRDVIAEFVAPSVLIEALKTSK